MDTLWFADFADFQQYVPLDHIVCVNYLLIVC